ELAGVDGPGRGQGTADGDRRDERPRGLPRQGPRRSHSGLHRGRRDGARGRSGREEGRAPKYRAHPQTRPPPISKQPTPSPSKETVVRGRRSGRGADFDVEPELAETAEQATGQLGFLALVEVSGAEVLIGDVAREHVVDGGEHGGGDGDDRLFRT